jgi:hypothetical protein
MVVFSIRSNQVQNSQTLLLGDVAIADDRASLAPLVLCREPSEDTLVVQLSASVSQFEVQFQLENENLRVEASGATAGGCLNELFNRTGFVSSVTFDAGVTECQLVVVIIPKLTTSMADRLALMANTNTETAAPTSFRDFDGSVCLSYDEVSRGFRSTVRGQEIPIEGRYCCTLMSTDLSELSFQNCEPNQTYVREFSVWNRSVVHALGIRFLTVGSTSH